MAALGGPSWEVTYGSRKDLFSLIRHLRSAAAHKHLIYSPDAADVVEVTMADTKQPTIGKLIDDAVIVNAPSPVDSYLRHELE